MQQRRRLALVSVILLMVVWGSTFVVTKATAREFPPLTLAFLRFVIAGLVLAPIALARGGLAQLPRPLPLRTLALVALTGGAVFTVAFNYALLYGSATQGALIYAGVPAAVAVAARAFLGELLSRRRTFGIALSVAGVALIAASGERDTSSPEPWLGALCMIGAVLAFAGYTVFTKRLADADQLIVTACTSTLAALMLAPAAALELLAQPWPSPSPPGWVGLLFLGLVASAGAFIVYGRALRELEASVVGALANLDPIVGVATAFVFLGETLHGGQIGGAVLALTGMWLASAQK